MADTTLFQARKVAAGTFTVGDETYTRWENGPDRLEVLCALPFVPAYIEQMSQLSHFERLPLIIGWYEQGVLESEELNRLLCDCWSHGGYPFHQDFTQENMRDMLREAGFVTDTPGLMRPTAPLMVWRGGVAGAAIGFSWTTDLKRAVFFAERQECTPNTGAVWETIIQPDQVLGIFHGRSEAEVVVDPFSLTLDTIRVLSFEERR